MAWQKIASKGDIPSGGGNPLTAQMILLHF